MRLLSVCTVLIPLLTVEGTRVITPAWGCVIQTGDAVTLAGLTGQAAWFPESSKLKFVFAHRHVKWQRVEARGHFGETKPWSYFYNQHSCGLIYVIQSNIYIHYTQTEWAVSSYTNTSEGIWLPTATERLWSVASINDISANATQKNKERKKKAEKHW